MGKVVELIPGNVVTADWITMDMHDIEALEEAISVLYGYFQVGYLISKIERLRPGVYRVKVEGGR